MKTEVCTYPRCKCIVSTSTSTSIPECPRDLPAAILDRGEALTIAAYLLDTYQQKTGSASRAQQIAACGEKTYTESMIALARLIIHLHPELRVNIASNHIDVIVREDFGDDPMGSHHGRNL